MAGAAKAVGRAVKRHWKKIAIGAAIGAAIFFTAGGAGGWAAVGAKASKLGGIAKTSVTTAAHGVKKAATFGLGGGGSKFTAQAGSLVTRPDQYAALAKLGGVPAAVPAAATGGAVKAAVGGVAGGIAKGVKSILPNIAVGAGTALMQAATQRRFQDRDLALWKEKMNSNRLLLQGDNVENYWDKPKQPQMSESAKPEGFSLDKYASKALKDLMEPA